MERQKTLLYIKPLNSSFIIVDEVILSKYFRVISYLIVRPDKKWKFIFTQLLLGKFLILNAVKADAFVCWFGDYHAAVMVFLAKIFNKKSVIFAGGQEAICYRELGKGVYQKKFRGWMVKYALRNATLVLPNHQSLIYHENYFYNSENPHIDGIRHYVKGIKGRIEVVPNGIDPDRFYRDPKISKNPNLVLTVGTAHKIADFYNKGFDLFIELARLNPNRTFVLIGVKNHYSGWMEEKFKVSEIKNLKIIPSFCPDEILHHYYNEAQVYLQVSITEGMPVSLGEAMLCECIPVGSNVNGIPDAIGDTGVIVFKRDLAETNQALAKAFTLNTGTQARDRTYNLYSISNREKKINTVICGL